MSSKGAGAIVWSPPTLEIAGTKYELRRLGLMDIERLAKIVAKLSGYIDRKVIGGNFTAAQAGSFLIDYLPAAFDDIVGFLATVIGLEPGVSEDVAEKKRKAGKPDPNEGTIRDPNVFPLGSELRLIEKLTEHQDVVAFFAATKGIGRNLKTLFGRSSEPSTESKDDTDGQTSTSSGDD